MTFDGCVRIIDNKLNIEYRIQWREPSLTRETELRRRVSENQGIRMWVTGYRVIRKNIECLNPIVRVNRCQSVSHKIEKQSQFAGLWAEILNAKSEILNKRMIVQNKANFHVSPPGSQSPQSEMDQLNTLRALTVNK